MSGWNKDRIREKRRKLFMENNKSLSREQLIDRIIELETVLYPFAYVLGSLDAKCSGGTTVSSNLFPLFSETDNLQVYKDGETIEVPIQDGFEKDLHTLDYYTVDSITIINGDRLDDSFRVLEINQSESVVSIGCGGIHMKDIRDAVGILFEREKVKEE